jgi:hypothetical protein
LADAAICFGWEDIVTTAQRVLISGMCFVVALCATTPALAQARPDVMDPVGLSALTAEIRQLRLAIEEATRRQVETQALAVSLSAQQSRLVQIAGRADVAREQLNAVTVRQRDAERRLTFMVEGLGNPLISAEIRRELEGARQGAQHDLESIAAEQKLVASRDAELMQAMQSEEARWMDLISRLEQLLRR